MLTDIRMNTPLATNFSNLQGYSTDIASFRKAISTHNKEAIEKYLAVPKLINETDINAALFLCIENFKIEEQSEDCLCLLLRNKANPNCEINGQTPLLAACKTGQIFLVKTLLENGAKPDLCTSNGRHPLECILRSRKQNYDIAEILLSTMSTVQLGRAQVNIDMKKQPAVTIAIQNQFYRIFKMFLEHNASYVFPNEETILHVIMRKKFRNLAKKKMFLKEVREKEAYRSCVLQKDQRGKVALDYEEDPDIRAYYVELFKEKVKPAEKEKNAAVPKTKEKEFFKQSGKENGLKESKKKTKEDLQIQIDYEQSFCEQVSYVSEVHEEGRGKIIEAIEEEEDQKKVEEDKEKPMKKSQKLLGKGKGVKKVNQNNQKPGVIREEKEKGKKLVENKKKGTNTSQITSKNRSVVLLKPVEVQEDKKDQQGRKKTGKKTHKEDDGRKQKILSTQLQPSLQHIQLKAKTHSMVIPNVSNNSGCQTQICSRSNGSKLSDKKSSDKASSRKSTFRECKVDDVHNTEEPMIKCLDDTMNQRGFEDVMESQVSSEEELQEDLGYGAVSHLENILTEQIELFAFETIEHNKAVAPLIETIRVYLEAKMRHCLAENMGDKAHLELLIYGSQLTGLAVRLSDVDMLVRSSVPACDLMELFQRQQLFTSNDVIQAKFLANATVPIIKLQMTEIHHNFKVDLTFQSRIHTGIKSTQLIIEFMHSEPILLPLLLFLKNLIYSYGLGDTYTGGLGSYSLALMTIALLQSTEQSKTKENLGKLLLQFFLFYGFQLDYVCQAVIIHPPGVSYKPIYSIYQLPNTLDLSAKLVICDPVNPVNNVGRATYRIACVKKLFKIAYIRLVSGECTTQQLLAGGFNTLIMDNS